MTNKRIFMSLNLSLKKMDSKYLIPIMVCLLVMTASATAGGPCNHDKDCDTGEVCQGNSCMDTCTTDADCPDCGGKCVGGVCYRDGSANCEPIIGEVIPIEPMPNPADLIGAGGVDPSDLIAPGGGMGEVQPLDPDMSPEPQAGQDMTLIYLGIIAVLVILVALLFMKKK
jgi:hypothetical protein